MSPAQVPRSVLLLVYCLYSLANNKFYSATVKGLAKALGTSIDVTRRIIRQAVDTGLVCEKVSPFGGRKVVFLSESAFTMIKSLESTKHV